MEPDLNSLSAGQLLMKILLFPTAFQGDVIAYAWGSDDLMVVAVLKRIFLVLPVIAILFALWFTVPNVLSLVVRPRRGEYINLYLLACWDLGRSVFSYIAGVLRFLYVMVGQLYALIKMMVVGLWMLMQDLLLSPIRAVRAVGRSVSVPGLPWVAAVLTVAWCLLEAVIFSYVMTPLASDTLSNLTGGDLKEYYLRPMLFLFLLVLILGSYAVLAALAGAIKERSVAGIFRIAMVEITAAAVEVVFLYREFVDALVPWFAMHASPGFEPGAGAIIMVALLAWVGIRGMTWFLFASHGTPILLALIQGQGLGPKAQPIPAEEQQAVMSYSHTYVEGIKKDMDFLTAKGEELMGAFLVPPMQLVASCLNFVTLLVSGRQVFQLPFKGMEDLAVAAKVLKPHKEGNGKGTPAAPPAHGGAVQYPGVRP